MYLNQIVSNTKDLLRRLNNIRVYRQFEFVNPGHYYSLAPFDYYKCIFIHIPKTAGISVSLALFGNLAGGHKKIREYQTIFPKRTFDRYFKFAFVRNPWDRVVSTYFYLIRGGINEADKAWAEQNIIKYPDFKSFVVGWLKVENIYSQIHFVPQFEFLINSNGILDVDFIGRFENLESDFETIKSMVKTGSELEKHNHSKRGLNYTHYYDEETKEIVRKVYKKDIDLFGYTY